MLFYISFIFLSNTEEVPMEIDEPNNYTPIGEDTAVLGSMEKDSDIIPKHTNSSGHNYKPYYNIMEYDRTPPILYSGTHKRLRGEYGGYGTPICPVNETGICIKEGTERISSPKFPLKEANLSPGKPGDVASPPVPADDLMLEKPGILDPKLKIPAGEDMEDEKKAEINSVY